MGQAKKRGSVADRVAQSQGRQLSEPPHNIPCRTCQQPLNDFSVLKTTPAGAAWQAKCECGAVTTALVQAKDSTLDRTFRLTLGIAQSIVGDDKKVSVQFYEKNLNSIETGAIPLN